MPIQVGQLVVVTAGLFLQGCTGLNHRVLDHREEDLILKADPAWFKAPERFASRDREGEYETHAFFDLDPLREERKGNSFVRYVLLTPKGSPFAYELDLVSGKKYKQFNYCSQKDIWERYSKKIKFPPFHAGFVPRLLSHLGHPQKIWVFGKLPLPPQEEGLRDYTRKARVVGGIILEYCNDYPCRRRESWVGDLILIGVDDGDPRMAKIKTLDELKKKVNWDYVKAFAENGLGRTLFSREQKPAYRLLGDIEEKNALDFAFNKGHFFSLKEMDRLKKSCFSLYDYLWQSAQKIRKKKVPRYRQRYDFLLEDATSDSLYRHWQGFFWPFYKKYGNRLQTCQKFVRPSQIAQNYKRHWFFAYLMGFIHLEILDYYYSCAQGDWVKNSVLANSKRRFHIAENKYCSRKRLNQAFPQSVTQMTRLSALKRNHFRYITYDSGVGNSGEKIYSWVFSNGKGLGCSPHSRDGARGGKEIFPSDIRWENF